MFRCLFTHVNAAAGAGRNKNRHIKGKKFLTEPVTTGKIMRAQLIALLLVPHLGGAAAV